MSAFGAEAGDFPTSYFLVLDSHASCLFDCIVGGEGLLEAGGEVGHAVESVGISFKTFQGEWIDHGGIVEAEKFHVAELVDRLVDDVYVGIFFAVGADEFLDHYL